MSVYRVTGANSSTYISYFLGRMYMHHVATDNDTLVPVMMTETIMAIR